MKISVAMTTYNGEKYIIQQLDSIRRQTKHVNEVCIFDDKSCDSTVELVKNYILKYGLAGWSISVNEKNVGFIENFRKAIGAVSGDVIFLADQDDVWREDKVEVMTALLESHPEISVLASAIDIIDQNGSKFRPKHMADWCRELSTYDGQSLLNYPYLEISQYSRFPGCTQCMRREISQSYLHSPLICCAEHDRLIDLIASSRNGLYCIGKPLLRYRVHSDNTIGTEFKIVSKNRKTALEAIKNKYLLLDPSLGNHPWEQRKLEAMKQYMGARVELYEKRSFKNIGRVLLKSIEAIGTYSLTRLVGWDFTDILFAAGILYKEVDSFV